MKMPPTKLLIFGNPKGGTPLMLAAPSIAIDLPLKILVWEDAQGKVWLSYNSPEYLKNRHGLPQDLLPNIAVVKTLAAKAARVVPLLQRRWFRRGRCGIYCDRPPGRRGPQRWYLGCREREAPTWRPDVPMGHQDVTIWTRTRLRRDVRKS